MYASVLQFLASTRIYIKKQNDLLSMQMAFCCSQWAYFSRTDGVNCLICRVLKDKAAVIV